LSSKVAITQKSRKFIAGIPNATARSQLAAHELVFAEPHPPRRWRHKSVNGDTIWIAKAPPPHPSPRTTRDKVGGGADLQQASFRIVAEFEMTVPFDLANETSSSCLHPPEHPAA